MYRQHYSRFLSADPERLHFAAHSHHLWPDVTRDALLDCWDDAARLVDAKWDHIFSHVIPEAQRNIAESLGLKRPGDIALAPSTHELVARLLSCFAPSRPLRILTTDSEFHSFARQVDRLDELEHVHVTRIPVRPFDSFEERFRAAARREPYDVVYFSHVFFNSGFVVSDLPSLVESVPDDETVVVIDGYHAFAAIPVDVGSIGHRVFYVGGGYKYAQAGEGICFMSLPRECRLRPLQTGWFASFGTLEQRQTAGRPVAFADDAFRFWGATFDPAGAYRLNRVFRWLRDEAITWDAIHEYVQDLQRYFLAKLPAITKHQEGTNNNHDSC